MTDEGLRQAFPRSLRGYRCLSCLKINDRAATYLAENTESRAKVIVKVSDDPETARQLRNEARLLNLIAERGAATARSFPTVIRCDEDARSVTLVRSYVAGETVDALVETRTASPGMARNEALDCAISVLELLCFLHRMEPPVIHRDIKPQNIVVDSDGRCHLIDLGISRLHNEADDVDTRVMGTRVTAPPEQFGYRQTDARSDIYSAGVLLRYCLTGEYADSADASLDPDIRRVVERATMFDPTQRYQRAEDMLRAVKRLRYGRRPRGWVLALIAATIALAVAAVILLSGLPGRYDARGFYHFREPLIERAVRKALGRETGGLTRNDLASVAEIHLFGSYIYDRTDEFYFLAEYTAPYSWSDAGDDWKENGGVRSLDDIAQLTGLTTLELYNQSILSIDALSGTSLEALGLGFNPIADLSPLNGNESIRSLNLTCLPIEDASALSTLTKLETLEISGTEITSLNDLQALPVVSLNLVNVPIEDFVPLKAMHTLKALKTNKTTRSLLESLTTLDIEALDITGEEDSSLDLLNGLPALNRLSYRTAEPTRLGEDALTLPYLEALTIKNISCDSLEFLAGLTALRTLDISECAFDNPAGLETLNALQTVVATEEQTQVLEEAYPNHPWEIRQP